MQTAQGLTQQQEVLQVTSKEFVWHWTDHLWLISADNIDELSADSIAKLALGNFMQSGCDASLFNPDGANPIYVSDPQYKKINE